MTDQTVTVQLSVSAMNLPKVSEGFKDTSSPFCVVTMLSSFDSSGSGEKEPMLLGMTEVIEDTSSPEFNKTFFVSYEKGDKPCFILIKILDEAYEESYREMGVGIFDLRSILDVEGKKLTKKLKNGGCINLHATEAVGYDKLHLKLSGSSLVNARGTRKKCIPFYQLSRRDQKADSEKKIVHRSAKYWDHSLNPCWFEEKIDVFTLCNGNFNLPLMLSIFHYKSNGKHVLIGEVETSVSELVSAGKIESPRNLRIKKNHLNTGFINVRVASVS